LTSWWICPFSWITCWSPASSTPRSGANGAGRGCAQGGRRRDLHLHHLWPQRAHCRSLGVKEAGRAL
jgi:hypothetical protein